VPDIIQKCLTEAMVYQFYGYQITNLVVAYI